MKLNNKLIPVFIILIMLAFIDIKAQSFEIKDTTFMYDDVMKPAVFVSVDPEVKTLKNAWQDFMKSNYDLKLRGRKILSAEEVKIQQISSNTLNFYTLIEEDNNGATMKVFASKGYDINISAEDYPEEYGVIREMVENFLKQNLPNYYNEMVVDTEHRIQELTKDKQNIEQDLLKEKEKLEELRNEISERQDDLMDQENRLMEAKNKLEQRLEKLERIRKELRDL